MATKKRGRPAKASLPQGYTVTEAETGIWIVRLNGHVRHAAFSKERAEEYVRSVTRKAGE